MKIRDGGIKSFIYGLTAFLLRAILYLDMII